MILLVVDTQKGIMDDRLYAFDTVRNNILRLINTARASGTEVVFVRHDDGPGTGFSKGDEDFEIYEAFTPQAGEQIFDKFVNSAFHPDTGLLKYLREKAETQVMIVGLQTDYCMDATIKSGFEHGFMMVIPEYANSAFDNKFFDKETAYRYYNEIMWPGRYGKTVSMEEAVRMLEG